MLTQIGNIFDELRELTLLSVFVRYTLAVVLGGIIGMERGKKRHAAGLRTHLVVCIGSASVMMVSQYMFITMNPMADPARLGAQVISGIGFLGVGTIVVTGRNQVKGLTTAAGLWASACMGLAIGIGFYEGAIMMCLFLYLVLEVINRLDEQYIKYSNKLQIYVEYNKSVHFGNLLQLVHSLEWYTTGIELLSNEGEYVAMILNLSHNGKESNSDELITAMREIIGVLFVEEF